MSLAGACLGCGRGIPHGYLYVVTKYETIIRGKDFNVHQAVELWCHDCKPAAHRNKPTAATETAVGDTTLKTGKNVLMDMIAADVFKAPLAITAEFRGNSITASVRADGSILLDGESYATFSAAGGAAKAAICGEALATNGWAFWQYTDEAGVVHPVDDLRKRFPQNRA